MRTLSAAFYFAGMVALWAAEDDNLIRDAGFEDGPINGPVHWSIPEYWAGDVAPIDSPRQARQGRRCLRLVTTHARQRWWGRILYNHTLPVSPGQPFRYSMWVRGKGEFLLGVIRYTKRIPGQPHYSYLWQEESLTLSDEWQEASTAITIVDSGVRRMALVAELRAESAEAWIDEVAYVPRVDPGATWRVTPEHPMINAGGETMLTFHVSRENGKPVQGTVDVFTATPEGDMTRAEKPLANGIATLIFEAPETGDGLWQITFAHQETGAARQVAVDVLSADRFARFEAAASAIHTPDRPVHILVLGDSLTDFHRGSNYVDKIAFWLRKNGQENLTVKNAGVGGDCITRVWDRLNQRPGVYRADMYDRLLDPKPHRILIFLGHNDSKASSKHDYTTHCVPPDAYDEFYRKTVRKLKQETGADITIISATSSVYDITKTTAEKRAEAGQAHSLFGKPEHLEAFNAIAKTVAADTECHYLDVYTPTRDAPDKRELFMPDGVHVNNRGNRLLAWLLLRHMASWTW